ncbi:DUF1223 domain-containing protein [Mucilaginibacter gossypii]|uniref:DUF1223 domain-containing protein n=1 Tax=Mucilaginibacter gossypii TaxID=551996 RepID=UPI000DCD4622|nr:MULTISPECIES: DUF1223 domain-containing protein [Mucilaginibacter]QTE37445.1 DUF1223 domain-containing protein [Mucilaginibacter gossypii]RAV52711.1 DUF1223 domain-containing protein [Mucilaginibacter rubeus]
MKTLKIFSFCVGTVALALATAAYANRKINAPKTENATPGKGFALVELFTSEGCSSCPPADELLARIQKDSQDKPVYILAYHVDYWNNLGWKDVFSNAMFSKRQKEYSYHLNAQVYTPQVIVNGKTEMVGSDEPALRAAISSALTTDQTAQVSLKAQQNGDKLTVNYELSDNTDNQNLLIAIVQKSAISKVAKGENEGRTLSHAQIVRDLKTIAINQAKKGKTAINIPKEFNQQGWEVVGFIQNKDNGEVLTATKAVLTNEAVAKI